MRRTATESAHIAQSVEHFLGKEEVTGSNPVMGSSHLLTVYGRTETEIKVLDDVQREI